MSSPSTPSSLSGPVSAEVCTADDFLVGLVGCVDQYAKDIGLGDSIKVTESDFSANFPPTLKVEITTQTKHGLPRIEVVEEAAEPSIWAQNRVCPSEPEAFKSDVESFIDTAEMSKAESQTALDFLHRQLVVLSEDLTGLPHSSTDAEQGEPSAVRKEPRIQVDVHSPGWVNPVSEPPPEGIEGLPKNFEPTDHAEDNQPSMHETIHVTFTMNYMASTPDMV